MSKSRIFWPLPSRSSAAGCGSSATPGGPSPCWPGRSSSPCNIVSQIFLVKSEIFLVTKKNVLFHYWHYISSKYVECCGVMNGSLRHLTMPPRGSASSYQRRGGGAQFTDNFFTGIMSFSGRGRNIGNEHLQLLETVQCVVMKTKFN